MEGKNKYSEYDEVFKHQKFLEMKNEKLKGYFGNTLEEYFKDPNVKPEKCLKKFAYKRISTPQRPKGLKRELVSFAHMHHIYPKVQKRFWKGEIETVFQFFGITENIKIFEKDLAVNPRLNKLNWFTEKAINGISLYDTFEERLKDVKELLSSVTEIGETEIYLKRPKSRYSNLFSTDAIKDMEFRNMEYKQDQNYKELWNQGKPLLGMLLSVSVGAKFFEKLLAEKQQKPLIDHNEDINKNHSSTIDGAHEYFIEYEDPTDYNFVRIGKREKNNFVSIYPTEPPTLIIPFILEIHKEMDWKNILIFDEHGIPRNNSIEIGKIKSTKFFYGFKNKVESYLADKPKMKAIIGDEKIEYAHCLLSALNFDEDYFLEIFGKSEWERKEWINELKVPWAVFELWRWHSRKMKPLEK